MPTLIGIGATVYSNPVMAGGDTYAPNAWLLNGTNQYMTGPILPRHQTDEAFLFTAGFTLDGPAGVETTFWGQNDYHFSVVINTSNKIFVFGNSGTAGVLNVTSTDSVPHDGAEHALAIHGDLSTASPVLTIVLDGVVIPTTVTTLTGSTVIDFQASGHVCGAKWNVTNFWDGCLWNIGLDHGDSADIPAMTIAANRNAIMSGNKMKDPGEDASNYFGRQPVVFFQAPAATAGTNSGTGGAADDFSIQNGPFVVCG